MIPDLTYLALLLTRTPSLSSAYSLPSSLHHQGGTTSPPSTMLYYTGLPGYTIPYYTSKGINDKVMRLNAHQTLS